MQHTHAATIGVDPTAPAPALSSPAPESTPRGTMATTVPDVHGGSAHTNTEKTIMANLTLDEVASRLGKNIRQVRYLLETGKLQAHMVGRRWYVDAASLPLSPAQVESVATAEEHLVERAAAALGGREHVPTSEPRPYSRGYSVQSLRAFPVALALAREATSAFDTSHPAAAALRGVVLSLSEGCHRFHRDEKGTSYRRARDQASLAIGELHLHGTEGATSLADQCERELLPAISSLVARVERKGGI